MFFLGHQIDPLEYLIGKYTLRGCPPLGVGGGGGGEKGGGIKGRGWGKVRLPRRQGNCPVRGGNLKRKK